MHKFRGIKTSTPARAVALWAARSSWGRLESLQIHQMLPLWFFWTLLPNFFFSVFLLSLPPPPPVPLHHHSLWQLPRQQTQTRPQQDRAALPVRLAATAVFSAATKTSTVAGKILEPRPQTRRQPMKTCRGCLALRRFSVFLSTWGWLLKMRHKCGVFIHFDKCLDVRGGGFMSSGFSLHLFSQCYHVFLTLTCYSWLFKSLKCIRFQIWTQFN